MSSDRVRLGPPSDDDLKWILDELARPETARTLGWSGPVGAEIYGGYVKETALLLPFTNGADARVGFIMLMRSDLSTQTWSVNIVVPDPRRRNAFTALAACDALCHLVFDIRGDTGLRWRIEPTNGASRVLPKRLGYLKQADVVIDGTRYEEFLIGPSDWAARKDRLQERGRCAEYEVQTLAFDEVAHGRVLSVVRRARA